MAQNSTEYRKTNSPTTSVAVALAKHIFRRIFETGPMNEAAAPPICSSGVSLLIYSIRGPFG